MGKILTWWLRLRLESTVVLGATALLALIALCAVLVHLEEGWSWIDSFYFAIVSITTVGYGDLVPRQEATRLFLIFYLPLGIGVALTVLASMGTKFLDRQRQRLERVHDAMEPHEEPEGRSAK
jgi:voltage-gated potassium channel Kch